MWYRFFFSRSVLIFCMIHFWLFLVTALFLLFGVRKNISIMSVFCGHTVNRIFPSRTVLDGCLRCCCLFGIVITCHVLYACVPWDFAQGQVASPFSRSTNVARAAAISCSACCYAAITPFSLSALFLITPSRRCFDWCAATCFPLLSATRSFAAFFCSLLLRWSLSASLSVTGWFAASCCVFCFSLTVIIRKWMFCNVALLKRAQNSTWSSPGEGAKTEIIAEKGKKARNFGRSGGRPRSIGRPEEDGGDNVFLSAFALHFVSHCSFFQVSLVALALLHVLDEMPGPDYLLRKSHFVWTCVSTSWWTK